MRARVLRSVGAHSFGMGLTIFMQLLSLPLFLTRWDAATYGQWLMLSAIPAYLSMTDVGMATVAGNRMTMAMGRGDVGEANRIFQSAQVFLLWACLLVGVIATACIAWLPLPVGVVAGARWSLLFLCAAVLIGLFGGLGEQVFRATGRAATGAMAGNLCRLAEWLGSIAGLLLDGRFMAVALGALACRFAGVALVLWHSRGDHGLRWGWGAADGRELKDMTVPALALMALTLANALSFQGVTLVVGATLGPVAVALFNTYRTLARTAVQATGTLNYAVWPEFSRLAGQGGGLALRRLFLSTLGITTAVSLVGSLVLYLLAPTLLRVWTHGAIGFEPTTMAVMLAYAAVAGIWHAPRVLLMATNAHTRLSVASFLSAVLLVLITVPLATRWGAAGAATAMLLAELFIAFIAFALTYKPLARAGAMQARAA